MIGIYKITNKLNNESYIGQSINIHERILTHLRSAQNPNSKEYNTPIHQSLRKNGITSFEISVLEECLEEQLDEREQYWIAFYDSYHNGYNQTEGGERASKCSEEKHHNVKLSKQDVIDIRTRYNNLERRCEVYELYKDKIGKSGFEKVWKGETWKKVMPEVYTLENRNFHANNTGNIGSKNGRSILTEEMVIDIRTRYKNGETVQEIYKDYESLGITYGSFKNTVYGYNWTNIKIN